MDSAFCDRRDECLRRDEVTRMVQRLEDANRADHKEMWEGINATSRAVNDLAVVVGKLTGRLIGYTAAAMLLVAVVSFLASKVYSP